MFKFKHFLIVIGIFTSYCFYAQDISEEKAQIVAKNFISLYSKHQKSTEIRLTNITDRINKNYNGFYIFKNATESGFYIISATNKNHPILAYSFNSKINEDKTQSPEFLYLLSGYQECNEYLIKNKSSKFRSEENTVINNEWKALLSGTFLPLSKNSKTSLATSVSPLIKTMWNQSPYYNKLTPVTYEGTSCVTGCVATTMAQIMKFWNYPDKGIGSHSYVISNRYYNWKGKTLTADFEKSYYQWNNMPIYLSDNSTSQQVDAVATLMLHAGISVDMMYSPSGSGAYSSRALLALKNYFNYSNDIEMKYRSNYTNDTDWLNLVKEQLSKGFPVYFSGNSSSSGHAFIADGYDSNNLIHFNLGWGGFFDGYYQITNPQGYSNNQSVIINIKPPCSAPTGLTVSNISSHSATLAWNTMSLAQSYVVEYKPSADTEWIVATSSTTANSITLSDLNPNTKYLWRVKTNCSDSIFSEYSQYDFTTIEKCPAPTNLTISNLSTNDVIIKWDEISMAKGYTVEYKTSINSDWIVATTSLKTNTLTLSNLISDTKYLWRVKTNCSDSNFSEYNQYEFTTLKGCPAPTGLTISNLSTNGVYLNWNAGKDNQTFRVEYKASDEDKWNVILLNTKGTSLILYGLKENTAYLWRIKTNCTDSKSPYVQGSFNTLSSCFSPSRLIASDITENSVNLRWNVISSALSYTLEYRASSDNEWTKTTVSNGDSSITLTGLKEKKRYYWRVKSNCSNSESSEYTENTFLTLAICPLPSGLATTNILTNSAILNWNAGKDNQTFRVEYKASDEDKWNVILLNTKGTSLILYGLKENTAYLWRIKTNCTDSKSPYVQGSFNTLSSCFSPSRLIASDITENSVNLRWNVISSALSYTLEYRASSDNEWTKTTVSNRDSSITLTGLKEKKRYYWRVKSNCSNSESSEYTENTFLTLAICPLPSGLATTNILTNSAILNWNAGKDNQTFRVEYKASDEDKWNVILLNTKGTSLILYGLKENTAYLWRIKTNCTDSKSPYVQGSFNTLSSCFSPSRLIASDITENSVNLRWNVISSALSYTLEYRASSDNEWTKTTVSNGDSSITLTGLKEKKRYYWRVKSNCSNSESSEYTENTFLTLAICPLPSGLATTNILTNSAILNWNAGKDNQTFRVEYKASDEDKWNVILLNTKGTSLILYGLKENTAYLWRIKTNCTDSKSSYVQGSFNTSSSMSDMLNDDFDSQNKKESKYSSISLYPNPVEEIVYIKGIEFKENDNLLITIIDRNGKIVKTVTVQPYKKITVDVSELTSNLYFLRIKDQTFKFIKK